MKIFFSHGKESGPWGTKIKYLAQVATDQGHDVESIDYRGLDYPEDRITKLGEILEDFSATSPDTPFCLIGSSMGSYVSLVMAEQRLGGASNLSSMNPKADIQMMAQLKGLFLMAPAVYIPGYECTEFPNLVGEKNVKITLVHGYRDEIIPYQFACHLGAELKAETVLLEDDHGLNHVLSELGTQFIVFLQSLSSSLEGKV